MESVERNQVGSRVVRGWEWASPTVQLGPLQKVVLQVGSQLEENSLWCKQTVYIEAFLWKRRLMFGAICTLFVGQPAERVLDAGLQGSSTGIREGRDNWEDFPGELSEQPGHQQAGSLTIHNL